MRQNENLLDLKYVNRAGDSMEGPLSLNFHPLLPAHAAHKAYVDLVLANMGAGLLPRDGSRPMTGPLTLSGVPTAGLQATGRDYVQGLIATAIAPLVTQAYVDAADLADRAYADAQDALRLLLGGGVMTGFITLHADPVNVLHAATKQYVDGLPPATLDTYDAVVAAAGGDYTDIVTACATEAAGARIYIKPGTYAETANIVLKDGQMLVGANPENTIINFGAANRKITNPGGCTNQYVADLTIQGSLADYAVELQGDFARVDNCRLIGSAAGFEGVYLNGNRGIVSRCHFTGFDRVGSFCIRVDDYGLVIDNTIDASENGIYLSQYSRAAGNILTTMGTQQIYILNNCLVTGNEFTGGSECEIHGDNVNVSVNTITGATGLTLGATCHHHVITGNHFLGSQVDYGGWVNAEHVVITGNMFNAGAGIDTGGKEWVITGNAFEGAAGILLLNTTQNCVVTGNNLENSTAAPRISNLGTWNIVKNNVGVPVPDEQQFFYMRNLGAGALAPGEVVVFIPAATGFDVGETVNQGDDLVMGVCQEAMNVAAYGKVQTLGKCVNLKCNGVINIGIGDLLGCFTVAGIAMQAQAGDMAFAIALEAYAGADSNGVIDALLITPRKV